MTDREVVPTEPTFLWTIWFFYVLWLIYKGRQKLGFLISGVLLAFVWHISLGLITIAPLLPLALAFSRKKLSIKWLIVSVGIFLFLSTPLLLFELRHNFQQTKAVFVSLTTDNNYIAGTATGLGKLDRVFQLVNINSRRLISGDIFTIHGKWYFYTLVFLFLYLIYKKKISYPLGILMFIWVFLIILFFTKSSINVSEYYLNGINVIWIIVLSLSTIEFKTFGKIFLFIFCLVNLYIFFTIPINQSGYLQRKSIVGFIKSDALERGYPCVSVSYITSPGNNFGYRQFFYLANLHVNQPKSGSPVYSIVFPHSMVDKIDKSFGALGLVLPDYKKYNMSDVYKSCEGDNANLTEPMFGFTK